MVITQEQEIKSVEVVLKALEKSAKKAESHESVAPLTMDFASSFLSYTPYWARVYLLVAYHNVRKAKEIVVPEMDRRYDYYLGIEGRNKPIDRQAALDALAGHWEEAEVAPSMAAFGGRI